MSADEWKQHFPTYQIGDKDIGLHEYDAAARNLDSDEKLFLSASNIAMLIGAGLASLTVGFLDKISSNLSNIYPIWIVYTFIIIGTISYTFMTIKYFCSRHKSIVFSSRKIIVLRRMLGLNYGPIRLVLPNWRVEGADEPFAIKIFPGWLQYPCYPFYVMVLLSTAVLLVVVPQLFNDLCKKEILDSYEQICSGELVFYSFYFILFWVLVMTITFRMSLLDYHENYLLLVSKFVAKVIRVKLVPNFEYTLYRAILSIEETKRFNVSINNFKTIVIFLEDRGFADHCGISLRSIVRAIMDYLKRGKRSGASTITQQLSRTLFIKFPVPEIRRKIIEMLLAVWLEKVSNKKQIIEMYIVSVRYELDTYGVISAMKFFFGQIISQPSRAQAFFLVERISNIRSAFLVGKIRKNLTYALEAGVIEQTDLIEIFALYADAIKNEKIIESKESNLTDLEQTVAFRPSK